MKNQMIKRIRRSNRYVTNEDKSLKRNVPQNVVKGYESALSTNERRSKL